MALINGTCVEVELANILRSGPLHRDSLAEPNYNVVLVSGVS